MLRVCSDCPKGSLIAVIGEPYVMFGIKPVSFMQGKRSANYILSTSYGQNFKGIYNNNRYLKITERQCNSTIGRT